MIATAVVSSTRTTRRMTGSQTSASRAALIHAAAPSRPRWTAPVMIGPQLSRRVHELEHLVVAPLAATRVIVSTYVRARVSGFDSIGRV